MPDKKIDLTEFLSQQYLCESLTISEVQTLLEFTSEVAYDKGSMIADIGAVGDALYFVVSGEVSLLFEEDGRESEIGRMTVGELVGEMSFFDRKPRLLRVRAATDAARLLKLPRTMYERLRVEHPYIAVNLLEHAIISLDHLVRRVSSDEMSLSRYMFGRGKKR